MNRRDFFKASAGAAGAGTALASPTEHDWASYDWGAPPAAADRLYQGPFPQYGANALLTASDVVMATTPSREIVPNYGCGLIVYVSGDTGPPRIPGERLERSIEDLIRLPFVQKVYLRPNWREIQHRPERLDFPDWWRITFDIAAHYDKRIGFRIMLENPDSPEPGMPEFLMRDVPSVRLKGRWPGNRAETRHRKVHTLPRYDHPAYRAAFTRLNALLAAELDGNPQIEFMDTMMYGFWGEGHSWPFEGNVFPDDDIAEQTWATMMDAQIAGWTRTPLVTNTQPDFNNVGNAAMLDRTVRSHNWIRSDTIFIENTQIEALSNRPAWTAAVSEVGMTRGDPDRLGTIDGVTLNEQIAAHVLAVGANYWSIWNWHDEAAAHVLSYYDRHPEPIDRIARRIGYRIYPAFIWAVRHRSGARGVVVGLANDGVAAPPGIVRLSLTTASGELLASGCVDAGYPRPSGIRQAMLLLSRGDWQGLRLHAALEVKGERHPVRWACQQRLNEDGSLTLQQNLSSPMS